MKIKRTYILLFIVAIFLGIVIGIQARTIRKNQSLKTDSGVLRNRELAIALRESEEEKERQLKEIEELSTQIRIYEKNMSSRDDASKELYDEIQFFKAQACLTEMIGSGIRIDIEDPKEAVEIGNNLTIIDYPDLVLKLISVLNSAGAEAISINGQRLGATSEIEKAQNHFEINGTSVNSPLVLHVLGDKDTLISALNIKNGIADTLRNYNFTVIISDEKELTVPKLPHSKEFIYAKPKED